LLLRFDFLGPSFCLDAKVETGTPYMLFKDACNSKSNQKNLGTIKSSNLCTEIIEYTDPDEVSKAGSTCWSGVFGDRTLIGWLI